MRSRIRRVQLPNSYSKNVIKITFSIWLIREPVSPENSDCVIILKIGMFRKCHVLWWILLIHCPLGAASLVESEVQDVDHISRLEHFGIFGTLLTIWPHIGRHSYKVVVVLYNYSLLRIGITICRLYYGLVGLAMS